MTEDGLGPPSQNTFKGEIQTPPATGPSIFKQTSVQAFVKQTTEKLPEKQNWGWNEVFGLCGECQTLRKFLDTRSGLRWTPLKAVDAALRGISQVIFVNNPISGLIILLGLMVAELPTGIAAIGCSLVAVATSAYFRQPTNQIANGLTQFNAVLVGSVMISLWPTVAKEELSLRVWLVVLLGASISVVVNSACAGFLSGVHSSIMIGRDASGKLKWRDQGVSGFTLPFNLVAWTLWSLLLELGPGREEVEGHKPHFPHPAPVEEEGSSSEAQIDFLKMLLGSLYGLGQVYGVLSVPCSVSVILAALIFSPILAASLWSGSILGCLAALGVSPSLDPIYLGLWSYCPLLTAAGCCFHALPRISALPFLLAAVVTTVGAQAALAHLFRVLGLPHLTLPFILTSWAFLLFSTEVVTRPEKLSTPEEHLAEHKRSSWETMVLGALVRQSTALSVLPAAATATGGDILPADIDLQCLEDGTMS